MPQNVNIHPTLPQAAIQYQTSEELLKRAILAYNCRHPNKPIKPKVPDSDSYALWDYHDIEKAIRFLNQERDRMMAENNRLLRKHNEILQGILNMLCQLRGTTIEIGGEDGESYLEWLGSGDGSGTPSGGPRALPEPTQD